MSGAVLRIVGPGVLEELGHRLKGQRRARIQSASRARHERDRAEGPTIEGTENRVRHGARCYRNF